MTRSHKTILVGVDLTARDDVALSAAAAAADRLDAERLHVVHVEPMRASWPTAVAEAFRVAVRPTRATVTQKTVIGGVAAELIREAREVGADLIVVATRRRGAIPRVVLGSVAASLIRAAPCPVLVTGADRPALAPIRRVLAAVDMSPVSEDVLSAAVSFARADHGLVHALSLFEIPTFIHDDGVVARFLTPREIAEFPVAHQKKLWALADRVRRPEVQMTADVMSKAPASRVILDVEQMTRPDLIVVGTSGHNAIERAYLGSTASPVIAEAICPVLVVPRRLLRLAEQPSEVSSPDELPPSRARPGVLRRLTPR